MAPSRVARGLTQSSSSSGIFFQGDGQSQAVVNSHLSSSYGNSSNSIPGTGRHNLGPVSGDMNNAMLNSVANSGPSVGASSLVTDANSAFSGGPHLQRSASINTDSYMRLPASPMSFSSNNISISGSSVVDGSSVVQQGTHPDLSAQQVQQSQQPQGASSATSLPTSQTGQVSLPMGSRVPGSFMQDPNNLSQAALALTNYQNLLMRQNSINSNPNSLQQEASPSFSNSNQSPSSSFQGPASFIPGSMQNLPVSGFSSPHLPPQQPQQLQQRSLSGNNLLQQSHPQSSQGNQAMQQQMIQQLLQEMSNNNGGVQQQSLSGQANGMMVRNGLGFGGNSPAAGAPPASAPSTSNVSGGGVAGPTTSRSNSFKAATNSEASAPAGNNGFNQRAQDLQQNLHLQDDIDQDIANEFTENGFFNNDLDDTMGWGMAATGRHD
ncbi:hypothetical protein CISIN_1g003241mg [Citrus sinensis]|uniref:Uncharacterized protein n=1 Tax=Citrus sinensis TaxID=2711 RepID=A0A067F9B9_CITSI|nr:hypothetical protein CISIN_1g003241mg [Citrus sinensis]